MTRMEQMNDPASQDQQDAHSTLPIDAAVLRDAMVALGNQRSEAVFQSALPPKANLLPIQTLAEVASLVGAMAEVSRNVPQGWQSGLDGALIGNIGGRMVAVVRRLGETHVYPNTAGAADTVLAKLSQGRQILHVRVVPEADAGKLRYLSLRNRTKRIARHLFWLSLLINGLALSVPFFSMAVYDRVLGGGAVSTLPALLSGAVVVLALLIALRLVRSRLIASEYSRLKALMELLAAQKLTRQPMDRRFRIGPERQLSTARLASGAAEVFSASNLMAIFDSPFLILTLVAILLVGGKLALVPLLFLALFFGLALLLGNGQSASDPEIAQQASERQIRIAELDRHAVEIRRSGLTEVWLNRFDQTVRAAARDGMRVQLRSGALQSVGFLMGTGTALVTLIVGLDLALRGQLSPGVLIGTMLLTWRITGPAQALFLGLPRLRTIRTSWARLENLLLQPTVSVNVHAQEPFPQQMPEIDARGLFYRFDAAGSPAVSSVSFKVEPGNIVAIIGPNGSGKSTVLRMLAGQLPTQSGNLLINGRAISQFDPDDLDLHIGYLDSNNSQAGADANAGSSYDREVAAERRAWEAICQNPAKYILLDDPLAIGGDDARDKIRDFLNQARGNTTVFFATHDTKLVELADLALVLDHGTAAYFGPIQSPDDAPGPTTSTSLEAS